MDKRFQVFVSSTYADLEQERRSVIQTLMEMDCIPAGMELFPASDDDQWQFIKKVIDDCDYYILILGGRYGSTNVEGIGYTEMEFDYAKSIGLKILSFVHENPSSIPVAKSELDASLREKFEAFRTKVKADRLVKFWSSEKELPGLVAFSLMKTIKAYPAIGWVRADKVTSESSLIEINSLQKENSALKKQIESANSSLYNKSLNLAGFDETFDLKYSYTIKRQYATDTISENAKMTWQQIFGAIAPELISHPSDGKVESMIGRVAYKTNNTGEKVVKLDNDCFQTVKVQLIALGLVTVDYRQTTQGGMGVFWSLTDKGSSFMAAVRTVKSAKKENARAEGD
ncbi:DUF4062 domain-containing protein [Allomesorhizobium camelthorni]|uniref:DUF4062 domain-containing protein n=1 Tax=Allomesorhizobium camelthorni TaxID=475069 RepID=A0A6G4WCM8_9HYPH|nr:DUF4062 domain-containing protein [Mesorhizobium camelthorni]NGO52344.1 DUF4062 domain-containing protein [Mesorhizobium camelthorni]